jgi:hypothetical protein
MSYRIAPGYVTLFDEVTLCTHSNQCDAVYPYPSDTILDYVLLIDNSLSTVTIQTERVEADQYYGDIVWNKINARETNKEQAATSLKALLAQRSSLRTTLSEIRVCAYVFDQGAAKELFPLTTLTEATVGTLVALIMGLKRGVLSPASTIGAAVESMITPRQRLLPPRTRTPNLRAVVLYSDGGSTTSDQLVETDKQFRQRLQNFKDAVGKMEGSTETCMYTVYPFPAVKSNKFYKDAHEIEERGFWNLTRMQYFSSYSDPGCDFSHFSESMPLLRMHGCQHASHVRTPWHTCTTRTRTRTHTCTLSHVPAHSCMREGTVTAVCRTYSQYWLLTVYLHVHTLVWLQTRCTTTTFEGNSPTISKNFRSTS